MPFTCDDIKVDIRLEHRCSTKKDSKVSMKMVSLARSVSVSIHWDVFAIGMEHSILFVYCICEALAITMARAELWPATPTSPKFAFSFALLDWAESLLLEAQVSLKDFCNSLKFRCHSQVNKVGIFMVCIYKLHYVYNIFSEAIANMMDECFLYCLAVLLGICTFQRNVLVTLVL